MKYLSIKVKHLILTFLLFILCMNVFCQEKHALIIALSEYNQGTNWRKINSFQDAELISEALKCHGFEESNIQVVADAKNGTRQGIINAIERLISEVNRGDVVVFHFSGHGQRVRDKNGDEHDGFDESIVPVDAMMDFTPGVYEGQNHIIDDDLGKLLAKLRQKLGPGGDLLVTLDACQSGTATRGKASKRGTSKPMASESYQPNTLGVSDTAYGLYEMNNNLSTMVVISATGPNENNYEVRDEQGNLTGPLSLALSKALITARENTTYRGLYEKIRASMILNGYPQTPQIEGNMDKQVLGGELLSQASYFSVIKTSRKNVLEIEIDAGELHGLFPGSEVSFYPAETRNLDVSAIVKGVVERSGKVSSTVILDRSINKGVLLASWGYVTNKSFGKMSVSLNLQIRDEVFKSRFIKAVQSYPFIKIVESDSDLFMEQVKESDSISLLTGNGTLLYQGSGRQSSQPSIQNILKSIIKYTQVNFLRHLENQEQSLKVALQIIPVSTRKIGRRVLVKERLPLKPKIAQDGILTFHKGDHFVCQFINQGTKSVYVSLIDIQPNNELEVLLPRKGETAGDYFIIPGDTLKLSFPWGFKEPYGIDILKLIATETELNLRSILDSGGKIPETRGNSVNPFEELFANTFKGQEEFRGQNTPNIPPKTAHILNQIIRIIPNGNN